ncbi:MAG: hypothetical protein C0489_12310 [Candidatus Accumulibacter sp.]|nr:hypothetical protein [Accumulibacter sp.]
MAGYQGVRGGKGLLESGVRCCGALASLDVTARLSQLVLGVLELVAQCGPLIFQFCESLVGAAELVGQVSEVGRCAP